MSLSGKGAELGSWEFHLILGEPYYTLVRRAVHACFFFLFSQQGAVCHHTADTSTSSARIPIGLEEREAYRIHLDSISQSCYETIRVNDSIHTIITTSSADIMVVNGTYPTINGVPVFFTPPDGYGHVDFEHPRRKNDIAAYTSAALGIFLALLFYGQFLYVKLRLLRKADAETGTAISVASSQERVLMTLLACLTASWIFSIAVQVILIRECSDCLASPVCILLTRDQALSICA